MTGAVGMITSPVQAEHIIRTEQADAVIMAREFLRDPYWALRAARELDQPIAWPVQYLRAAPKGAQARVPVNLKELRIVLRRTTWRSGTMRSLRRSNEKLENLTPGYWKIPLMGDGGDISGAHNSNGGNGKLTEPTCDCSRTFWKYAYEHSRPNESTRDCDVAIRAQCEFSERFTSGFLLPRRLTAAD